MKTILLFIMCTALLSAADAPYYGTWRLIKELDTAPITALDDKGIAYLIGKRALVQANRFTINGESCGYPFKYTPETQPRQEFYEGFKMDSKSNSLRLPPVVKSIDAGCAFLIPEGENRMIIEWKSVFFEAVRSK